MPFSSRACTTIAAAASEHPFLCKYRLPYPRLICRTSAVQAMRAVNQAMGRVIRHRWDYGAIILADERFRQPGTQKNMSRWVREHVNVYDSFGKAAASLTQFFKVGTARAGRGLRPARTVLAVRSSDCVVPPTARKP